MLETHCIIPHYHSTGRCLQKQNLPDNTTEKEFYKSSIWHKAKYTKVVWYYNLLCYYNLGLPHCIAKPCYTASLDENNRLRLWKWHANTQAHATSVNQIFQNPSKTQQLQEFFRKHNFGQG